MINITTEKGIDLVSFNTDKINAFNVEAIKTPVLQLFEEQNRKVLIDLNGVNYIDSTGFAMFLLLRRIARANYSTLKLCGMSESIRNLFRTLNLEYSFDILPDTESGLNSF